MGRITKNLGLLVVSVMFIGLYGCEKNEQVAYEAEDLIDETTFAENVFEQLAADVDEVTFTDESTWSARTSDGGLKQRHRWFHRFGFNDCAEVTREKPEDADFPVIITIDYGEGCSSWMFNVVKSGKVIIEITGWLGEEGSQRIVTFEDFHVNENLIEGIYTFTNLGDDSYSCTLVGGKITTPEGVITRDSERIRTRISGGDTDDRSDDVFEITGNASGKTINDVYYTKLITKPLIREWDCFWITSGTIETTLNEETMVVIDFGEGECDNIATKSINGGNPEEFEMNCRMKRWKWYKQPF